MNESQFKDAYVRLLTRVWSDEGYRRTVLAEPIPTLREAGFEIPDGATVRIDENEHSDYADAGLDGAAEWFNRGHVDGVFRLVLPPTTPVELAELGEEELAGMAGGFCCSCCCG